MNQPGRAKRNRAVESSAARYDIPDLAITGSRLAEYMRQGGAVRHHSRSDDLGAAMHQGGRGADRRPAKLAEAMMQGGAYRHYQHRGGKK